MPYLTGNTPARNQVREGRQAVRELRAAAAAMTTQLEAERGEKQALRAYASQV